MKALDELFWVCRKVYGGEITILLPRKHLYFKSLPVAKSTIRTNLLLHPLREENRNQGAFILGCKAAKAGCGFEAVYVELSLHFCGTDFPEEELKHTLESAYQYVADEKDEQRTGGGKTPVSDMATKRQVVLSENAETAEEDFQDGEELRQNTPYIPEEVYKNIPGLSTRAARRVRTNTSNAFRTAPTSFSASAASIRWN